MVVEKRTFFAKFLICAYLILKPFYLLDAPFQISDIILIILFVYLACVRYVNYIVPSKAKIGFQYYVCFMVWAILINMAWYLYLAINQAEMADSRFFTSAVYYIFNGIAMLVILWLYELLGRRLIQIFVYGNFASCMSTVLYSLITIKREDWSSRQVAGFQNPNQLAYYAVVIMAVAVLWGGYILTKMQVLLMLAGALYLNMISMSKAGILAGMVMILLCWLYRFGNRRIFCTRLKASIVLGGIGIASALLLLIITGHGSSILTMAGNLWARILNMRNENDSNLGNGRGYNRAFEMGANFLWGMGEGAYERFQIMNGNEIHSTIVSIYVSYGLIGLFLWGIAVLKLLLQEKYILYSFLCFSGIFLYWLTHNGVRNTIVWMVFMLIAISGYHSMKEGKNE